MKSNRYLNIGLIMIVSPMLFNRFIELPDFIYGAWHGIGIAFGLLGVYAMNHDVSKLKDFKKNILRKCFGQK